VLSCVAATTRIHSVTHQVSNIPNVNEERGSFFMKLLPVGEAPQGARDVSDLFRGALAMVKDRVGV
jgi:hypothetical protein